MYMFAKKIQKIEKDRERERERERERKRERERERPNTGKTNTFILKHLGTHARSASFHYERYCRFKAPPPCKTIDGTFMSLCLAERNPPAQLLENTETQAVLDGVPPTGLQLLRRERVLLMLWIKGLEHLQNWSKVVVPSGAPPEELYEKTTNNLWLVYCWR